MRGGGGSCDQLIVGVGGTSGGLGTLKLQIVDRSIVRSERKKNQG